MQNTQIERVMNLIRRTGDRCILVDSRSDDVLVMMQLGEYEKLLDGDFDKKSLVEMSEREMMNKVDREMAYWRTVHAGEGAEGEPFGEDEKEEMYFSPEKNKSLFDDWQPAEEIKEKELLDEDEKEDEPKIDNADIVDVDSIEDAEEKWEDDLIPGMEPAKETTFLAEDDIGGNNVKQAEPLNDLPEEDADTFLLEPV